ncbi:peptidoglycan DD-metalloendopeptidase family protein [Vibrio sp. CAIM 722]|uniref:Peptidoglycan DD-metalloendopeptidase family protein n=1 Tax=Vibrio eleionomae TaxID=2653505 RepID=A0A7X4RX43_9VIBR|nr:peptidoglycan DD-metalloendopeptidase family protein [Vibrio eleionomae]MZI95904.1 peptidoglycan DD-metalloendopeptidase family protein [Vibrio eleionomae]
MSSTLESVLAQHDFHCVIPEHLQHGIPLVVDLTPTGDIWDKVREGANYVEEMHKRASQIGAVVNIGRYAEERMIYQDTDNFAGREACTLHIGVDLGIPAGNPVFAPLAGEVLGFADHDTIGDYGPVVILRHKLEGHVFFTLYGHLARASLTALSVGQQIAQGQQFATIGTSAENGGWPTHLHFQIVKDMQGSTDDYTGVVNPEQADFYLSNCPDPNLILNISSI